MVIPQKGRPKNFCEDFSGGFQPPPPPFWIRAWVNPFKARQRGATQSQCKWRWVYQDGRWYSALSCIDADSVVVSRLPVMRSNSRH